MKGQVVTFSDFAAFVIATSFLVAVFVAPYIVGWHYMHPPAHRASYHPLGAMAPLEIPDKMPAGGRSDGVRRLPCPSTNKFPFGCAETGRGLAFRDGAAWNDTQRLASIRREPGASAGDDRRSLGSPFAGQTGHHLQTLAGAAASLCGIDPALFWSLILRESSGRHWDAQGRVLRSSSNALGMGQIKASTARGVSPHLDPLQPWDNAVASACYLRQQFDRFGTWRKALHAYHRGPNARGKTPQASHDYASDVIQGAN